ncbi:MAG: hypothetical protein AAB390_01825 [Patescibacteria group bacterium]
MLFIISNLSGSGGDSIIEKLSDFFPIERVITTNTRAMRPTESEGHPYYFISREEFERKIVAGEFFEYARGYNDIYYGVTKNEIDRVKTSGKIGIWKIEYKGVMTAKKIMPGVIAILITAPLAVLEARIRRRDNPTESVIRERMAYTEEWLKHRDIYDYEVVNDDGKLAEAVAEVVGIIKTHSNLDK